MQLTVGGHLREREKETETETEHASTFPRVLCFPGMCEWHFVRATDF